MYLHVIDTRYVHWGSYSGINQLVKYIDPTEFNLEVQNASDSDDDFPLQSERIRNYLSRVVKKKGMQWYKLSDLMAEFKALRRWMNGKLDLLHYLDAEHSAQYLPILFRNFQSWRPKMIATYHQHPAVIDSLINKEIIPIFDLITVVSPEQVSFFKEFIPPHKIRVILHGIDVDFFKPNDSGKKNGKFKCITVGHWHREFAIIREVSESLVNNKYIEFIYVTSSKAGPRVTGLEGLSNVTIHRENIDDIKLLNLYQQSDILFLPLQYSTANNALLEGIACGLPVVSTYLPSVKAYLNGKESILINGNNPKQFVEAILYLYLNPSECRKMGAEARKRAEELDWRKIAPQYEAIYRNLISE
jgi:glycosyltransferase involved in cell wall biosynthesis